MLNRSGSVRRASILRRAFPMMFHIKTSLNSCYLSCFHFPLGGRSPKQSLSQYIHICIFICVLINIVYFALY
ncbi:hypothetical protein XELAEV_18013172mg, partial [Xenopus laevis]